MPFSGGKTRFYCIKNQKTKQKTKNKKPKKTRKTKPPPKKAKIPKKTSFSVISQIFLFLFGGCPKFPFLTPWPKKCSPQNTIKIGVSGPSFWKADMRHKTAIFGPKDQKPKFINFS